MKLTIKYDGNSKGYTLEAEVDATIESDAEAMGYATMVLFKAAEFLAQYCKTADPKYENRIQSGIYRAVVESKNNPTWPFDRTITYT